MGPGSEWPDVMAAAATRGVHGLGAGAVAAAATEPTREVFQGFGLADQAIFYLLAACAILVFLAGAGARVAKYRRGRRAGRLRVPFRRVVRQGASVAAGAPVARGDPFAGLAHFLIFWGFLTLFAGTVTLTIDHDVVRVLFGKQASFFRNAFYLGYSLTLDALGLAFLAGLGMMAYRRWRQPPQLDYTRADRPPEGYSRRQLWVGDWLFLGLLGAIAATGFAVEGLRIYQGRFPPFEVFSPVGWGLARALAVAGPSRELADLLRYGMWWVHAAAALAFVAYVPYSKAMHMLVDGANLLFFDPASSRRLPPPPPGGAGYRSVRDFTWKELLDLDACTRCGRCHLACPAAASGAPLSPRDLILDLRQWADELHDLPVVADREERPLATGPAAAWRPNGAKVAGDVIRPETLWSCTTCMACVEACPVGIEHVPTIVQLRRSLVDEGTMEPSLKEALQRIAGQGNSFGKPARMRARWTKGLEVPVPDARRQHVQYLWFVGDYASFDERLQELSRTLARLLLRAGVSFGLLYEDERNAGNDVRRVGEEGLFELLVSHNLKALSKASFEEILTTDPHTFNTLRNEYPAYGLDKPVRHYTQLLADLLTSGRLQVTRPLGRRVTYHDPCYLARYNRITGAPRRIIEAVGCELVEMPRNRQNTFCCGAGGGRIWMDDSGLAERPSESRIREAVALGVEWFVVACPKDVTMYTDAVKTTGHEGRLRVVDIVQLVAEACDG